MKSTLLYILSIIITTAVVLYLKFIFNNGSSSKGLSSTNMQINQIIKAEVEVLNGCGDSGIASLYSNYLIEEGFDVIEINDDGYVLDWLKIIEKAEMIIMTDSVMANIVDQLMIGKKKYFLQKNNIFFTPILNSNWEWIENKNMDPKSIIMKKI